VNTPAMTRKITMKTQATGVEKYPASSRRMTFKTGFT
jgi:hypothetical protein